MFDIYIQNSSVVSKTSQDCQYNFCPKFYPCCKSGHQQLEYWCTRYSTIVKIHHPISEKNSEPNLIQISCSGNFDTTVSKINSVSDKLCKSQTKIGIIFKYTPFLVVTAAILHNIISTTIGPGNDPLFDKF
ncbi:hypothetical protein PIROE2DRAFT_13646 [Piromyces sp. E2]|nr:hypothetical protein PIROE2DRAFT_13646 [Piromyces sp. E2]|eukprot:OUM60563.1 hypothetical protein PIROE2DRAFT_13646 [Piromyces sp. E2]